MSRLSRVGEVALGTFLVGLGAIVVLVALWLPTLHTEGRDVHTVVLVALLVMAALLILGGMLVAIPTAGSSALDKLSDVIVKVAMAMNPLKRNGQGPTG